MKFILLLLLMCIGLETYAQNDTTKTPFKPGDVFVGVNSEALGVGTLNISLSPEIGICISNTDMIYGSVFYTKEPRVSTITLGWDKLVYKTAYVGVSGSLYGDTGEWRKRFSVEMGVMGNLWGWLYISPKLILSDSWRDVNNDFNVSTTVNFSIKI